MNPRLMELTADQPLARSEHEEVQHLVEEAAEPIAKFWPMKDFVHHNPLHGLEHLPFEKAIREAKHLLGGNGYLSNGEYRRLYQEGRITAEGVNRALHRLGPKVATQVIQAGSRWVGPFDVWRVQLLNGIEPRVSTREETGLEDLWECAQRAIPEENARAQGKPPAIALPAHRTIGDWLDTVAGATVVEQVNDQMTKWVATFVDEGMAGWAMPSRNLGLYRAWRDLAPRDFAGRFLGIKDFAGKVRGLPADPEDAIIYNLERLEIPRDCWKEYLSRHLAQLPGWAGFIRYLGEHPDYPGQEGHPTDPVQYLAVRLFYEAELAGVFCRRKLGVPGTVPDLVSLWQKTPDDYQDAMTRHLEAEGSPAQRLFRLAQFLEFTPSQMRALSTADVQTLLEWAEAFPEDSHGPVWLEAYEDKYRDDLLGKLASHGSEAAERRTRPRAQIVFCIDVRSESLRRHVEALGSYETYGFAGFFGIPMNYRAFDSHERFPLCPVLLTPAHSVNEGLRPGQVQEVQSYASGTRWQRLGDHLFHEVKRHPVSSFLLVDLLGFFFGPGLAAKTLFPSLLDRTTRRIRGWFLPELATRVLVDNAGATHAGASGFTLEEQANMVENGLRAIGLTRNFGRFIVVCGHGSVTENNPYFGALHCGACGGKHGDPSARAFAAKGNDPEVRRLLWQRGLEIPDDTWFLAAKHVTTSDRIIPYDVQDVPESHREELCAMIEDWRQAGAAQAHERCSRLPRTRKSHSAKTAFRHVEARTVDWANSRPEWGLSSNAAFIVGRRSLTQAASLRGRVFLHSYDPEQDPAGRILEKIMTAPLIVGEWINMEHYFSAVDPWIWGSGSKVIHNVVAGVGVMLGSHGDLQTGLPVQTVRNGAAHYHEPMRLLTVIEAPTSRIAQTIQKHELLQRLFHNEWLNLVAVDPNRQGGVHRYTPDGNWEPLKGLPARNGNVASGNRIVDIETGRIQER